MRLPHRILVCGGRFYDDARRVTLELGKLDPTLVIHGGARGADTLADDYAEAAGIERQVFKIRRPLENGYQRNARMLRDSEPDMVVAFPGGNGTADMVRRAKRAGIPVLEIA